MARDEAEGGGRALDEADGGVGSAPAIVTAAQAPVEPGRRRRGAGAFLALIAAAGVAATAILLAGRVRERLHPGRHGPLVFPTMKPAGPPHFVETLDVSAFLKGNIHTHTKLSDGDRPPEDVYKWYREHGYAFLAITDHNQLTDPASFKGIERPGFVAIPGEEVTMWVEKAPVHVNGLCTKRTIGGGHFPTIAAALSWAVEEVHAQGGVALVNHPNWEWALKLDDLDAAKGAELLEIASGHPYVHTDGDATHPSHEVFWDHALTKGQGFAGVAVDDMHFLSPTAPEPAARPGRGWVYAFGADGGKAAICAALAAGRLYSSTGVRLERIALTSDTLTVWSRAETTVEFIGSRGAVLAKAQTSPSAPAAAYRLLGGEQFVRARAIDPKGKKAWTAAYRAIE